MEKTGKPVVAGVLSIVAGFIAISGVAFIPGLGRFFWGLHRAYIGFFILPGIGRIILGIVAIIGGIAAIFRKAWGLALAGAIVAIPCIPVLGILSTIFVSIGKNEFS